MHQSFDIALRETVHAVVKVLKMPFAAATVTSA